MSIHRKNVSEEDSVVFTEQSTIGLFHWWPRTAVTETNSWKQELCGHVIIFCMSCDYIILYLCQVTLLFYHYTNTIIEVIQFGRGQRLIHSNRCHADILSGKKHGCMGGWHGLFLFQ